MPEARTGLTNRLRLALEPECLENLTATARRENAIVEGKIQRVQRFVKLAEFDDRYRAKADVRPLLAEKLSALNEGRTDARGTLTLALFVSEYYEPYARENLEQDLTSDFTVQLKNLCSDPRYSVFLKKLTW